MKVFTSVTVTADLNGNVLYKAVIEDFETDTPYRFQGHCKGGLDAFGDVILVKQENMSRGGGGVEMTIGAKVFGIEVKGV